MSKALISDGYRTNSVVIISALALLSGVAFFLFALSPALIERFRLLASMTDRTATVLFWLLPAVAAGVACGGAALGVLTFVRLIRELEQNLFGWLAPLLAIFSAFMISGVPFELPGSAVNKIHFAVLSSFIFVGGGALILLPRWSYKALGIALSLFPVEVFILGYALQHGGLQEAWIAADKNELYVLFMMTGTCAMILFIAFVVMKTRTQTAQHHARESQLDYYADPNAAYQWGESEYGQEGYDWQESQYAAGPYGQQYPQSGQYFPVQYPEAVQQRQYYPSLSHDDERALKLLTRKRFYPFIIGLTLLLIGGVAAGAYYGWVKPRAERAAAAQRIEKERIEKERVEKQRAVAERLEARKREMAQKEAELERARIAAEEAKAAAAKAREESEEAEQAEAEQKQTAVAKPKKVQKRNATAKKASKAAIRKRTANKKQPTVRIEDDPLAGI
jgi:hypothetical protein